MYRIIFFTALLVSFAACQSPSSEINTETTEVSIPVDTSFAACVGEAHGKTVFNSFSVVEFDIQLFFGGTERLNAHVSLNTDGSAGHFLMSDSTHLIYENGNVYTSNPDMDPKGARFAAYTWSYFFLFPYKLKDPGTRWTDFGIDSLNGNLYRKAKLEFEAGTGDAPDDWYMAYADPTTYRLHGAAYIVTASSSRDEAEADPHAITYSNYNEFAGVPLANRWDFWEWREQVGLTKQLGYAELKKITLSKNELSLPENYKSFRSIDQL